MWHAPARNLSKPNLRPISHKMGSPATAIVWELWRKNRWGFWVVLGSFLCGLAVRLSNQSKDEVLQLIAGAAMVVCFVVTFAIFSYAESGAQISFPTRTFALPVRTRVPAVGACSITVYGGAAA